MHLSIYLLYIYIYIYTLYQTLQPSKSTNNNMLLYLTLYNSRISTYLYIYLEAEAMPCFVDEVLLPFSDLAGPLSPLHPTWFFPVYGMK